MIGFRIREDSEPGLYVYDSEGCMLGIVYKNKESGVITVVDGREIRSLWLEGPVEGRLRIGPAQSCWLLRREHPLLYASIISTVESGDITLAHDMFIRAWRKRK